MKRSLAILLFALVIPTFAGFSKPGAQAQTRTYPDKIRGYKVERTVVEVKRPTSQRGNDGQSAQPTSGDSNVDQLISLGNPTLARVTPLGITFDVPMVVAPVTQ